MRGWLAALRTELRHGIAPWVLLAVTLTVIALLWLDHSADWGGRWNSLGGFMRELVIVLGPVCVTLGAWQGGRGRRAGVGELLASTRRTVLERQSVEIAALWLVISAGVLLGWASAAWTIVLVGGWGTSAAVWYLLGLFPAVLAYTTAGYAIGSLAPWRIVAPVAGAATYVGLGILLWSSDKASVPMGGGWLGGTDGYPFDLDALLLSLGVLLLAALALWGIVSAERRPGASWQWLPVLVAGALGTAVLAPLAVAAADSGSPGLRMAEDTPLACTPDEPEVCVLAEDRLLLPETTARARPVLERLQAIPGAPTVARPMRESRELSVLGVEPGETTPWGKVDDEWGGEVHIGLYDVFAPDRYCPTGRFDQAPRPVRRAFRGSADLLVSWTDPEALDHLTLEEWGEEGGNGRVRDLGARFAASTERQRTAYAGAVLAAARECDIAAARSAVDALAPAP
ncbi:MAG: hypothetical protein H0U62_05740 [Actinobacteria bacterium]|nr:hypothetical protein [Actinomycetota bacterium]